ncbi:MAG: YybH family protein [Gemmatimonadota bacterium]
MRTTRFLMFATLALATSLGACRFEVEEEENLQDSIEALLQRGADAWNDGDLDGYVATYADGASTTMLRPEGRVVGRAAIRSALAPRFAAGARRDSIRLDDVEVRPLPPLIGIVTGRYLSVGAGNDPTTGWFTVVVRRAGDGWRIVHDQRS